MATVADTVKQNVLARPDTVCQASTVTMASFRCSAQGGADAPKYGDPTGTVWDEVQRAQAGPTCRHHRRYRFQWGSEFLLFFSVSPPSRLTIEWE